MISDEIHAFQFQVVHEPLLKKELKSANLLSRKFIDILNKKNLFIKKNMRLAKTCFTNRIPKLRKKHSTPKIKVSL